ncbi:hypothetical protein [Oceanibaculum sp.]|uniref:hypothetical protein n=1 Tax=Oceanibaculum sp. TaxID=1903597 RepID=UPI00258AE949|nr:hypothetical protein [Oceanibaculum sp.]MCH2395054.1 hypothetical protein [Oceanibaculum sp.]
MTSSEKPVNRHARFGLRGPYDLLRKMSHDWKRMRRYCANGRPECSFAALDFAISAWSMVDWIKEYVSHEDLKRIIGFDERGEGFSKQYYDFITKKIYKLRLCKEIANGSKHFIVSNNPDLTIKTKSSPFIRFQITSEDEIDTRYLRYYLRIREDGNLYYADEVFRKTWMSWRNFLKKEDIDQGSGEEVHLHTPEMP